MVELAWVIALEDAFDDEDRDGRPFRVVQLVAAPASRVSGSAPGKSVFVADWQDRQAEMAESHDGLGPALRKLAEHIEAIEDPAP